MDQYKLAIDGDGIEKFFWDKFIKNQFPSYEKFWQKFVVPLTDRPSNIHFKNDRELRRINKTAHDICLAQLHYSVLRHLARAYLILNSNNPIGLDELTEGMARICGALDVADEFLERLRNSTKYDPWSEKDGEKARHEWRKFCNSPQDIRNYRNHLIHGRLTPSVNGLLPKIGKEKEYFDWRKITDPRNLTPDILKDFINPRQILIEVWNKTLGYLEENWQKIL